MHAAIIVTAIALVAVTAALALAPQLHPGYRTGGRGPGPGHGGVGHRVAGLLPGIRPASPPHPAERTPAGVLRSRYLRYPTCSCVTVPAVAGWAPDDLTVWSAPVASSFGALLFVLAAFLPDRQLRPSGPLLVVGAGGVTTALLLTMVFVPALARSLPPQVMASLAPGASARSESAASGAVRPATRGGGTLRSGRRRVPAVFRGGAATSSSAGLPLPPCWLRQSQVTYLLDRP